VAVSSFAEPTVSSQLLYSGRVIRVRLDEVRLPDGSTGRREVVEHPGAVAVFARTADDRILLVRQFRKPLEREIWEIPAGKLEPGEDPAACAQRELAEETGYVAERWAHVASFYTSPGFANEIVHLYRAEGLTRGVARPDAGEFVEPVLLTWAEAQEKVRQGLICDAKTLYALALWELDRLREDGR